MKKALKILVGSVLGLVLLILIGAFVFMEWPQIVVNREDVAYLLKHSEGFTGQSITWKALEVNVKSLSFTEKRLAFRIGPGCVSSRNAAGQSRICFSRADLALAYSFSRVIPRLAELGPIRLLHVDAWMKVLRSKPIRIPGFISTARMEPLLVQVDRFKVEESTGVRATVLEGSAEARGSGSEIRTHAQVRMLSSGRKKGEIRLGGSAVTASGKLEGPWHYELSADYRARGLRSQVELGGEAGNRGISGVLNQSIRVRPRSLPRLVRALVSARPAIRLTLRDCQYSYLRAGGGKGEASLSCPLLFELKRRERPLLTIAAHLETAYPYNPNAQIDGKIDFAPVPWLMGMFTTRGAAAIELAIVPSELPRVRRFSSQGALETEIPRFHRLVRALRGSVLAIPSPLHALRGSARSRLRFSMTQRAPFVLTGSGSLDFATDLASREKTQALKLRGRAGFDVLAPFPAGQGTGPTRAAARGDLLLADVRIALPKINPAGIESFFPDTRLGARARPPKLAAKKPSRTILSYVLHVHTPPGHPVVLRSHLTSAPVPIDIDLTSSSHRPLVGEITIRRIPVKLAGISKTIGRVNLRANTANRAGMLSGSVSLAGKGLNRKKTRIPAPAASGEAAGQKATGRAPPQFPVPIARVVSSVLLGTPLDFIQVRPGTEAGAVPSGPRGEPGRTEILRLRNRF